MEKAKWFSGRPPSVGWWPASRCGNEKCLRWWDGEWSEPAFLADGAEKAGRIAQQKALHASEIEWTTRPASWPKRSRT